MKNNSASWVAVSSSKELVNSWDLFDTLMTRFYLEPEETFRVIDSKFPGLDYFNRRIQAQRSLDRLGKPYDLYEIYRQMVREGLAEHDAENLLLQELFHEQELLFPIRSNIEQVSEEDIIVTDMYLSDQMLSDLVWKICGLRMLKPVVRSNWGKSTGTIWPEVLKHYVIRRHFGDHPRSDFETPRRFGIHTRLVTDAGLTPWEKKIAALGEPHLALLLREARLRGTPSSADPLLGVIGGAYLTLLYAYSVWLHLSYGKRDVRFVFLRRDCEDLSRVFAALFPGAEVKQIDLNRHIAATNDPGFNGVLAAQLSPNSLLVDVVGTGRSVFQFMENADITVFRFTTLIYLDALLRKNEVERRHAEVGRGRFDFFIRQSELGKHHYPLECLLQTEYPPVVALGLDVRSGGIVRSHGKSDLSHEEKSLVRAKSGLVQEFMNCLQRRSYRLGDIAAAELLIKESLGQILDARDIPNRFPSFLARERAR
jgi:hypothetical protein